MMYSCVQNTAAGKETMLSNFNIAGLSSDELEHLISERCASYGAVKRVAICDSFPIVNYKLAFVAMSTPAELATVIKAIGATSIGDAAVIRLDMKPAARRTNIADVAAVCIAAIAGWGVLSGLYLSAEQRKADAAFVQVFSKLEPGQSRKQVEGIAAAVNLGLDAQSPAIKPNRAAFAGSCCASLFAATRYDLLADYDAGDRLLNARLLKSHSSVGGDDRCSMLFEMPSLADKVYPYECPANGNP
jgi:hypothetical protein